MKLIKFKVQWRNELKEVEGWKINRHFAVYKTKQYPTINFYKPDSWCIVHIPSGYASGYASTLKIANEGARFLVKEYRDSDGSNLKSGDPDIVARGWTKETIMKFVRILDQ